MAINFGVEAVDWLDKELLLNVEGYLARPVTVNQSSLAGITSVDGHYIIPQGSYLYGANGTSLLEDPNQLAVVVVPAEAKATATINNILVATAKAEGAVAIPITLSVATDGSHNDKITYDATNGVNVVLGLKKDGITVKSDYETVMKELNSDREVNSVVVFSIAAGQDGSTVADAGTATTASGGSSTVASDIDGILYHSVDVTRGEAVGTMVIHGIIDVDKMSSEPGAAIKAKLPHIQFARKD